MCGSWRKYLKEVCTMVASDIGSGDFLRRVQPEESVTFLLAFEVLRWSKGVVVGLVEVS